MKGAARHPPAVHDAIMILIGEDNRTLGFFARVQRSLARDSANWAVVYGPYCSRRCLLEADARGEHGMIVAVNMTT